MVIALTMGIVERTFRELLAPGYFFGVLGFLGGDWLSCGLVYQSCVEPVGMVEHIGAVGVVND